MITSLTISPISAALRLLNPRIRMKSLPSPCRDGHIRYHPKFVNWKGLADLVNNPDAPFRTFSLTDTLQFFNVASIEGPDSFYFRVWNFLVKDLAIHFMKLYHNRIFNNQ